MNDFLNASELMKLMKIIRESHKIIILGHKNPDGDAAGAALAWANYLNGIGKSARVVLPNSFPDFLRWLPGAKNILFYNQQKQLAEHWIHNADLICCLDFGELGRLGEMASVVEKAKATRMVLDHHLNPDKEGVELLISRPDMSATCEIVFRVIEALGGYEQLTHEAAVAIYCGMMTDTGGFTYNSMRPEIFEIIAALLRKGIDKDAIYRNVFHSYSINRLKLQGYILYEKLKYYYHNKASLFTLTREEMKEFHYIRGDSEGFVNMPLQVKGMRLSISLREDTEQDVVRVSLRSVEDFPCNIMAQKYFNGGGHKNASGGELPFPLSEAIKTVEQAIAEFCPLYIDVQDENTKTTA